MGQLSGISVIIPVHNESDTVAEAVKSVLAQEYQGSVEIIAACNGCDDNSAEVARQAGARVVESSENGMSFGKNLGGKAATEDVLLFLDADSRLLPGALAAINRACVKTPGRFVGTVRAYLDEPTLTERVVMQAANVVQYLRKLPTPSGAIFIDRITYEKIGGFDENIPQGTSSDIALRAVAKEAVWIYAWKARASTSPRRFRKVGILRQMFSWVANVHLLRKKRTDKLADRDYENIR